LIVSHSSERSGAPKVLLDIADSLSPDKYDLTLCFPAEGGIATDAARKGYRVKIIPNPQMGFAETASLSARFKLFLSRLCFMFRLRREVKKGKYDLVYLNSTLSFYAGAALLRVGMKCIWHIHEHLTPSLYNRLRRWVTAHIADVLIFVSPSDMAFFRKTLKTVTGLFIPNGVAIEKGEETPDDAEYRERFHYAPTDQILATVSFISRRKGIDIFLEALRKVVREFPRVKGVVVGDVSLAAPEFRKKIEALAAHPELTGHLFFPGYCRNVRRFLECISIFVLPARSDSMPLAVLDAMMAGKAVVATDVGCLRQMLDAPEAGVVVSPESPEAIAEALLTLLHNPERRKCLGTAALERARREYSMEIFQKRINNIVEETLKGL